MAVDRRVARLITVGLAFACTFLFAFLTARALIFGYAFNIWCYAGTSGGGCPVDSYSVSESPFMFFLNLGILAIFTVGSVVWFVETIKSPR